MLIAFFQCCGTILSYVQLSKTLKNRSWWKMQFIISGKDNSDLENWYMPCSVPRSHWFRDTVKWRLYLPALSAEKEMETHPSTLAWKIPWPEEPGRLQSMGSKRVKHDWATSLSPSVLGLFTLIICQWRGHHMGNHTAVWDLVSSAVRTWRKYLFHKIL